MPTHSPLLKPPSYRNVHRLLHRHHGIGDASGSYLQVDTHFGTRYIIAVAEDTRGSGVWP